MTIILMQVSGGFLQNLLPNSGMIFHNRLHLFTYKLLLIIYLTIVL